MYFIFIVRKLSLKGECVKPMTEKDCYAHLPTKVVIMNIYQ
jgi:hypothetical protein